MKNKNKGKKKWKKIKKINKNRKIMMKMNGMLSLKINISGKMILNLKKQNLIYLEMK